LHIADASAGSVELQSVEECDPSARLRINYTDDDSSSTSLVHNYRHALKRSNILEKREQPDYKKTIFRF